MKLAFLALALAVLVRAEAQEIHIHGAMKATVRQGSDFQASRFVIQ